MRGEPTRTTFAGLDVWEKALWYSLSTISTAIFLWGVWRLVRKYRAGRASAANGSPSLRNSGRMLWIVLSHGWIGRRAKFVGLAHAGVFYGFLVLFAGTAILAFQDHVAGPLGWHYWRGAFYEGYSLFLDLFGAALVAGLLIFGVIRYWQRPFRLAYQRPDRPRGEPDGRGRYRAGDRLLLGALLFLGVTGFLLEALRIAADHPQFETWSPIGWTLGTAFRAVGLKGPSADATRAVVWWVHGVAALAWVAAIPFTKAVHMLVAPLAVAERDERPGRRLVPVPADATEDQVGYQRIGDLSPKHLLDLDACTKCGRCHEVCPARASGMPLSPRDVVLDLREMAEGSLGSRAALGIAPGWDASASIVSADGIAAETLWSCMHCMACVDVCPVGIEHVPIINQIRRGLVERGEIEPGLQATLERVQAQGNSFGEPRRKRARWASDAGLELPDARTSVVDMLWYVGDYASFDPRNQRATVALARLLAEAGVEVGLLYESERTAGHDVRRIGEEMLFQSLAEQNMEALAACQFSRILTSDPHTFNTLRNEYPLLGAPWTPDQVVHHSLLLDALLADGSLEVRQPLNAVGTYHDPCALGRYNGFYEEPRRALRATGLEIIEMPRNRDQSFCCGAGGGRIWMSEPQRHVETPRPSESRIHEALELPGVQVFAVACPKDVTMYEAAIATTHSGDRIRLAELSELVLSAVLPDAAP